MTLWLLAVIPTPLPNLASSQIMRAAVCDFPVPGGPWMARKPGPSRPASRSAASSVVSPRQPDRLPLQRRRLPQQEGARGSIATRADHSLTSPHARRREAGPRPAPSNRRSHA